jgi:hypothetical protein
MATEQVRCSTKDYSELFQQRHELELRIAHPRPARLNFSWPRLSRLSRDVLLMSQTLSEEGGPYGCCEK